jgi:hypothetical protein
VAIRICAADGSRPLQKEPHACAMLTGESMKVDVGVRLRQRSICGGLRDRAFAVNRLGSSCSILETMMSGSTIR